MRPPQTSGTIDNAISIMTRVRCKRLAADPVVWAVCAIAGDADMDMAATTAALFQLEEVIQSPLTTVLCQDLEPATLENFSVR